MDKPIPEAVLLPCPFCGGEGKLYDYESGVNGMPRTYREAGCTQCYLRFGYAPAREAVAMWNRRSLAAQQPDHIVDATKMAAQQQGQAVALDRMAIRLLVAAGFVTEDKANEALRIAHGFDKGPLAPKSSPTYWEEVKKDIEDAFLHGTGVLKVEHVPLGEFTAPPSAPVGVEKALGVLEQAAKGGSIINTQLVWSGDVDKAIRTVRNALAQQPAAVDELIELLRDRANDAGGDKLLEEAAAALEAAREDAERYRWLRTMAREQLLNPKMASSEYPDMRTYWRLPTLICSGPVGGFVEFDAAIDQARGKGVQDET